MPATVAERCGPVGVRGMVPGEPCQGSGPSMPADPADRITYAAGDQAQWDLWFPVVRIPVGAGKAKVSPVLVMVSSHSRFIIGRDGGTARWFGAVPRRLTGRTKPTSAGGTATRPEPQPSPPSWQPGSCRSALRTGEQGRGGAGQPVPEDFLPAGPDILLSGGLQHPARPVAAKGKRRLVRRTGTRPLDLFTADKAAMLALPPVPPVTGFPARVWLSGDYYVRMGSDDYSVHHPQAIGRFVDIPTWSVTGNGAFSLFLVPQIPVQRHGVEAAAKTPAVDELPAPASLPPGHGARKLRVARR